MRSLNPHFDAIDYINSERLVEYEPPHTCNSCDEKFEHGARITEETFCQTCLDSGKWKGFYSTSCGREDREIELLELCIKNI